MKIIKYFKRIGLLAAALFFSLPSLGQQLFFERVYDETLAQASYVIGDIKTGEAIVIDPKRDIDTYLEVARNNGLTIRLIAETHIHADFLSGSRELAAVTGAELLLSDEGGSKWQYGFPHRGLKDGDRIRIGQFVIEVMHTPGHTPESVTFLLSNPNDGATPLKAITGDFVFVGDVGRPDLLEKVADEKGTERTGAKQLYASIKRFSALPDNTEIWPGHGAGSFCGKSLSNIPQSTLRDEKALNRAFQFEEDEQGFIRYILEGQPEPPKYFAMMKHLNKVQRPLLAIVPEYPALDKKSVAEARQRGVIVIDTRDRSAVSKGYIEGSLHIEGNKSFATWMGSLIGYEQKLILIAEKGKEEDITRKLMRIGMDNIYGFVTDLTDWEKELKQADIIDIAGFKKQLHRKDVQVVDVRTATEYAAGHIKGAENIPLASLAFEADKIDRNKQVVIHCQSGARAAMAYSILKKLGFENVKNYSGGINQWSKEGNALKEKKK